MWAVQEGTQPAGAEGRDRATGRKGQETRWECSQAHDCCAERLRTTPQPASAQMPCGEAALRPELAGTVGHGDVGDSQRSG